MIPRQCTRSAVALFATAVLVVGCARHDDKASPARETATPVAEGAPKHGEWWCSEHGIPEAECSACSDKLKAEYKQKGDWCKEHDIAKSQCFVCNPSLKEKYAARYRAKYGKEPPPPLENMPAEETKKDDRPREKADPPKE